ncbi:MAG: VWA domain-containing protein [Calditrichaeota bacterium]|nr:MAG: VWA domain-containing protein [Calditrichota bacterium]
MEFRDPWYLVLLAIVPLLVYYWRRRRSVMQARLIYSDVRLLRKSGVSPRQKMLAALPVLRGLAVILLIIALARPQKSNAEREIITEGIDIVLALDVSSSMLAEDFKPKNRLQAVKAVARQFIQERKNDRIGMVVFAGESFTQCPLTVDYDVLLALLDQVQVADRSWDGTAIGMGLVNAINRLRDSKAKSRVIILLTDGVNNQGEVDPLTASEIAVPYGIRIYTIGAGTRGTADYPVDDPIFGRRYVPMEVKIDEATLQKIAENTGGRYFRATDTQSLKQIYEEIGRLEKTRIEVKEYTRYDERYIWWAVAAFALLVLEFVLNQTYLRRIP